MDAENTCIKDRVTRIPHARDREISFKGFDYRNTAMFHVTRKYHFKILFITALAFMLANVTKHLRKKFEPKGEKREEKGKGKKMLRLIDSR